MLFKLLFTCSRVQEISKRELAILIANAMLSAQCRMWERVGNSYLSFICQLNELMLSSLLLVALCWYCSLLCSCHYGTSLPYWIKAALNLALSSSDLLPSRLLSLSSCAQLMQFFTQLVMFSAQLALLTLLHPSLLLHLNCCLCVR